MLLRPVFMNGDEGEDTLQLTSAVRKLLREQSYSGERGRETPVYVDADELPGAVRISGVYKLANGQVEFKLRLRRGGEPKSVRLVLPQADIATMAATLVDRLNREIASPQ